MAASVPRAKGHPEGETGQGDPDSSPAATPRPPRPAWCPAQQPGGEACEGLEGSLAGVCSSRLDGRVAPGCVARARGCDWLGRRQAVLRGGHAGIECEWQRVLGSPGGCVIAACCPRASSPLTTHRVCPMALSSVQGIHLFSLLTSLHLLRKETPGTSTVAEWAPDTGQGSVRGSRARVSQPRAQRGGTVPALGYVSGTCA